MKSNLPPPLQDDPEDKWSNIVLPSLLLWCGDQANVWTVADSDLTHVLIAIIRHVYPSFNLTHNDVKHGSVIYNLACQRLARWRNTMGNSATHIVKAFLKENSIEGITAMQMATQLLQGQAFAYEKFDSTDQPSAFQSPPLLELLGLTHLQDTIGWVDIPGLDLPSKCDHGIRGVLTLCTAAIERAFQLAAIGKLEIAQNQGDGEEPTVSSRCNQKQPQTLNKATGKSSTKGTAFLLQNWGSQTSSYYSSILNRSTDTLGNIVASALCFLATTNSPPGSFRVTQPSVSQLGLDPRSQMCKPSAAHHANFP
ncbi:hypothetical protein J3R83DRAFT_10226 [Lanmaoa asiatica]|nr:hypothetical protein J3R83DRAFT_10226 [Lanmaoa asiatica]